MPTTFTLTATPQDLSATLSQGRYLAQLLDVSFSYYAAVPTSEPDPVDATNMFTLEANHFIVVNVGPDFSPVWVLGGDDVAVGHGRLILEAVGNG